MLQSLATLLFVTVALLSAGLISALLVEDWAAVRRALGLGRSGSFSPMSARLRVIGTRHVPVLSVTPGALRRAA